MADKKQIAKSIITGVGAVLGIGLVLVFPNSAQLLKWMIYLLGEDSPRVRRGYYDLQRRGMLRTKRRGGMLHVVLTQKGQKRYKLYQNYSFIIPTPDRWDGYWRIVMFDVPEQRRMNRNMIRRLLRRMGFVRIQKSVFIHPYPCFDIIQQLRFMHNLELGSLYVFEAKVLEGEAVLKDHFGLR